MGTVLYSGKNSTSQFSQFQHFGFHVKENSTNHPKFH